MVLSLAKKVHYDSGPNMTPLVDVVMVILIFLMLAGSFSGTEHSLASPPLLHIDAGTGRNINLPAAQVEVHLYPSDPAIDPNQEHFAAVSGSIRSSDPADLAKKLRELHDQYVASGLKEDKIQVIISPSPDLSFANIMRVYEATMRAKFTRMHFKAN